MSLELVLDFFKMTNVVEFLSNLQGRKFEPRRLQLADDVVVVDIVVVVISASSDADGLNLRSEKNELFKLEKHDNYGNFQDVMGQSVLKAGEIMSSKHIVEDWNHLAGQHYKTTRSVTIEGGFVFILGLV